MIKTVKAWIGHKSYILSDDPSLMIFDTRTAARASGWKTPARVKVTLIAPPHRTRRLR